MIEPSRLLAGRREMSRPEKDAILARVLARAERRPTLRRAVALGGLAMAGAAVVTVLALWPRPPRDELTARGGELPAGFEATCVPAPCAVGSKLVFDITSTGGARYFAAWAEMSRVDRGGLSGSSTFIWYFPTSRTIPDGGGVIDKGIVIGPEQMPGTWTIHGIFSAEPLDRTAVRAGVGTGVMREIVVR